MPPRLNSIDAFAERVVRARTLVAHLARRVPIFTRGIDDFPSDTAVRSLILNAFYASLESDEARSSRFVLSWHHPVAPHRFVIRFDSPLRIESPSVLTKIAHATQDESTISLRLVNGVLCIDGIAQRLSAINEERESEGGIVVFARNPGVIEYQEMNYCISYSRGDVRPIRYFWDVQAVTSFLAHLEKVQLEKAWADAKGPHADFVFDDEVALLVAENAKITGRRQLRQLLIAIQKQAHGGMIAIVKNGPKGIERRYPMCSSSLNQLLESQTDRFRLLQSLSKVPIKGWLPNALVSITNSPLIEFLSLAGSLGGVDGTLILNEELNVLEFGAIVLGSSIDDPSLPIVNQRGYPLAPNDVLRHRGTRRTRSSAPCPR